MLFEFQNGLQSYGKNKFLENLKCKYRQSLGEAFPFGNEILDIPAKNYLKTDIKYSWLVSLVCSKYFADYCLWKQFFCINNARNPSD